MRRAFGLAASLIVLGLTAAPAALANGYVVDDLGDADNSAGTSCGSPCTLRGAISAANARAGADGITFSVTGTIQAGIEPLVTDTLTIDGSAGTPGARNILIDCVSGGDAFHFSGGTDRLEGFVIEHCFRGATVSGNARV